jgi:hypothetical protein
MNNLAREMYYEFRLVACGARSAIDPTGFWNKKIDNPWDLTLAGLSMLFSSESGNNCS